MRFKMLFITACCFMFLGLSTFVVGADIKEQLKTDSASIQKNVDIALTELDKIQRTKGTNTAKLDTSIRNLQRQLRSLKNNLKNAEPGYRASLNDINALTERLTEQLKVIDSARNRSDWTGAKREFQNINRSAKALQNAALKLPSKPIQAVSRQTKPGKELPRKSDPRAAAPPAPPTDPNPPDQPSKNSKTYRAVTSPSIGALGPNDPRAAPAPAPPVTPEPPDPPDDRQTRQATPALQNNSAARKNSPELLQLSAAGASAKSTSTALRPITLRSGNTLYFSAGAPNTTRSAVASPSREVPATSTRPLSRAQISEAINRVRQNYNLVPKSGSGSATTPFITMSPTQTRGVRAGSLSDYDIYELGDGDHRPYRIRSGRTELEERNSDGVKCNTTTSFLRFTMTHLDRQKLYLADITASGTQWQINDEAIVQSSNGHILYAFSADSLPYRELLRLKCLGTQNKAYFQKIDVYEID